MKILILRKKIKEMKMKRLNNTIKSNTCDIDLEIGQEFLIR